MDRHAWLAQQRELLVEAVLRALEADLLDVPGARSGDLDSLRRAYAREIVRSRSACDSPVQLHDRVSTMAAAVWHALKDERHLPAATDEPQLYPTVLGERIVAARALLNELDRGPDPVSGS